MILIGSRALVLRMPQALLRKPLDFDFVCTREEYDEWTEKNVPKLREPEFSAIGNKQIIQADSILEFEIIQPGIGTNVSSEMLRDLVENNSESIETSFGWVPTFDMLFTIKSSHKYLKNSPHFWKTLVDYHIMKKMGAKVRPEYEAFLKLREKETYNYSHPKLNVKKDAFFKDDGLEYVYDHDTIHQSVARFDKPAYLYYMKDGEQVLTDKAKFFAAPREIQLAGVVEEAAVLAIERSLVPHPGVWTPQFAWRFALAKVCSSITSGWFREFAYENALEILKLEPVGYWDKFQEDVKSGLVKPFTGSMY